MPVSGDNGVCRAVQRPQAFLSELWLYWYGGMARVPCYRQPYIFGGICLFSGYNVRGIFVPGAEHPEEMPDYDLSGCRYPAVSAGSGDLPYRILSGDKPVGGGVPAGNGVGQGSVCHCPWDCIHAGCPGESVSDGVRLPACAFQKGYEEKRNLGAGRQGAFQMKRNVRKG